MKRRQISPAALPAIGQPFAGGFYAGRIYFDGAEYALIDAGRDFECTAHWWEQEGPRPRIRGIQERVCDYHCQNAVWLQRINTLQTA